MAHPPQQPSSNLSLRLFLEKVKEHNSACRIQRENEALLDAQRKREIAQFGGQVGMGLERVRERLEPGLERVRERLEPELERFRERLEPGLEQVRARSSALSRLTSAF